MKIGAQLYTVRDFCKTPEDLAETLKKVADIGYEKVQVSGTCPYDASWLKERLDETGLECVLTHTSPDKLKTETENTALDHSIFGCKYVGLGYYDFKDESKTAEMFAEEYTPVAKALKKYGKYFMYHNHDHEFRKENGVIILDKLAELMPSDDMGFTIDTYWIQAAGGDPAYYIEKLKGRVPCIHLKDYAYPRQMAVIGEGNINFDRVFEKAESSGTEFLLVEQDDCYGENPFDCLERSYKYLTSLGL